MSKPVVTLAPIKPILRIADVCELLGICPRQFHELRGELEARGLLKLVLPPLDRMPRYSGAPFCEWLSDKRQRRELAELLSGGGK
jgi:hypothetical protein